MCLYEMNPIKGFYKKLFTTTWVFPKIVVSPNIDGENHGKPY